MNGDAVVLALTAFQTFFSFADEADKFLPTIRAAVQAGSILVQFINPYSL